MTHFVYDTELDLLYDIVRHMPDSIESQVIQGRRLWFIWNETTNGENFAESGTTTRAAPRSSSAGTSGRFMTWRCWLQRKGSTS